MPPGFRCKRIVAAELRAAMRAEAIQTYACPTLLREAEHCANCLNAVLEQQTINPMPIFENGQLIAAAVLCCLCESESRRAAITHAIEQRIRAEREQRHGPGIVVDGGEKLN